MDQIGQPIITRQIPHSEGNTNETIQLQESLAHGVYEVEITGPDNQKNTIKVIN